MATAQGADAVEEWAEAVMVTVAGIRGHCRNTQRTRNMTYCTGRGSSTFLQGRSFVRHRGSPPGTCWARMGKATETEAVGRVAWGTGTRNTTLDQYRTSFRPCRCRCSHNAHTSGSRCRLSPSSGSDDPLDKDILEERQAPSCGRIPLSASPTVFEGCWRRR